MEGGPGSYCSRRAEAAAYEKLIAELRELNREVLAVAAELSRGTIETVLATSDLQLGAEALLRRPRIAGTGSPGLGAGVAAARAAVCRRRRGRSDRRTRAWFEFRGDRVIWGWWVRVCLPRMCPDVDTRGCPVSAPVSFAGLGVQQVVFISTGDAGRVSVISGCTGNGAAGVVGHPDFSAPSRVGAACTNQDGCGLGGCLRTFICNTGSAPGRSAQMAGRVRLARSCPWGA